MKRAEISWKFGGGGRPLRQIASFHFQRKRHTQNPHHQQCGFFVFGTRFSKPQPPVTATQTGAISHLSDRRNWASLLKSHPSAIEADWVVIVAPEPFL